MKRSPKHYSQVPGTTQTSVHDTAAGCREMADADLARASLMDTANGRRRLESSASSWTSRAELIERLEDGFEERGAIARAEWEEAEAASIARKDPDGSAGS